MPPSVEQVAEQAGVSVSSIFRNFDGLDDMQRQVFERFQARYSHLLEWASADGLSQAERVARLVSTRIELYSAAGPIMHVARQRALDYAPMADRVAYMRTSLATQAQQCLAVETSQLTPAEAANLLALIDAATSPEAYDVMSASHARTSRQISRTWTRAIHALIAGWNIDTNEEHTT